MSRATWTVRFGFQPDGPLGPEHYALITDRDGSPIDTFYGSADDVFSGVASLMKSEATGKGLG